MAIRAKELVQLWSLSKGRISQYVKAGMPLDSVQAAEAWRMANYGWHGGIVVSSPSQDGGGAALPPPPEKPDPARLDRNDAAGVRARVEQSELDAWRDLYAELAKGAEADKGRVVSLRKAYREAVATRLDSVRKLDELEARAGTVVSVDASQRVIAAALGPLIKAVRNLPAAKAAACNPANPGASREVLEGWVVETLKLAQRAVPK